MVESKELERLRIMMRSITVDIMQLVKTRMEIAQRIGAIKTNLNRKIEDEVVEQDIHNHVQDLGSRIGLDRNFTGRLLNLLLTQSVKVQLESSAFVDSLTPMDVFVRAKKLEKEGKKIIHLEVGEPDFLPPRRINHALLRAVEKGQVHYTESSGVPALRKELSKKFRCSDKERVIVTPGARFAIFSAIASVVNPGEEIIVFEPAWPAYRQCAEFIGAKVKVISTSLANGWTPQMDQLEKVMSENTKMIVLNYPNNPTGKIVNGGLFRNIVDLARSKDVFVLSDEVYAEYSYLAFRSILEFGYEKGIMISSFSKSHAMTGFRVGFGISTEEIVEKMVKVQAMAVTSVAEPIQYAALSALRNKVTGNIRIVKKRFELVRNRLESMPVKYYCPDGGLYFFVQISELGIKPGLFLGYLLERGVAVAPGIGFGRNYADFIRISVCQPIRILNRGLDIIESSIRNPHMI
ncbi:MAG TPA: aminotransferase class I/II-fold pyridoxal phosphate-dependent enzyme [Nitrososphaeraceae archaeon]